METGYLLDIHQEMDEAIKYLKQDLKISDIKNILNDDAISKLKKNKMIASRRINLLELEIINLAYLIIFFGLSKESRPVLEKILKKYL